MVLEHWTNPNVVCVTTGTGYHRGEGYRRASRNGRVSDPSPETPQVTSRTLFHRCMTAGGVWFPGGRGGGGGGAARRARGAGAFRIVSNCAFRIVSNCFELFRMFRIVSNIFELFRIVRIVLNCFELFRIVFFHAVGHVLQPRRQPSLGNIRSLLFGDTDANDPAFAAMRAMGQTGAASAEKGRESYNVNKSESYMIWRSNSK
jgi:hypothetical protein